MLKVWKWYRQCLSSHPVKTQVISSGILWGIGDVGAQYVTHSTAIKHLKNHVNSMLLTLNCFFTLFDELGILDLNDIHPIVIWVFV
uniref:Uncharacterized protein MANES_16G114800 n=1 Tax=Rhizophora mucronata TaxID=61149 RepID=A0A2P2JSW9_RHIMU